MQLLLFTYKDDGLRTKNPYKSTGKIVFSKKMTNTNSTIRTLKYFKSYKNC